VLRVVEHDHSVQIHVFQFAVDRGMRLALAVLVVFVAASIVLALWRRSSRSQRRTVENATALHSPARLTYAASCVRLQELGNLEPGDCPPLPSRIPRYDDEVLGVSFFRTSVRGQQLNDLTLARSYFGRSEISRSAFRNTDLSESVLCWTDFQNVDFSGADLHAADLRASVFVRCDFSRADLSNADLRHSTFDHCTFTGAVVTGAKLTRAQLNGLKLSREQTAGVALQPHEGPEPGGG
jgi:uncharacterized protein YjbI with pentapeptide repeats